MSSCTSCMRSQLKQLQLHSLTNEHAFISNGLTMEKHQCIEVYISLLLLQVWSNEGYNDSIGPGHTKLDFQTIQQVLLWTMHRLYFCFCSLTTGVIISLLLSIIFYAPMFCIGNGVSIIWNETRLEIQGSCPCSPLPFIYTRKQMSYTEGLLGYIGHYIEQSLLLSKSLGVLSQNVLR